jgi:hypothetical protein
VTSIPRSSSTLWWMLIRDIVASGDYMISLKSFYTDDGAICDNDPASVESLADAFKDRFERVGLEMNDIKTKAMIVCGYSVAPLTRAPFCFCKPQLRRLHAKQRIWRNKQSRSSFTPSSACTPIARDLEANNGELHCSGVECIRFNSVGWRH